MRCLLVLLCLSGGLLDTGVAQEDSGNLAVQAARIHLADGTVLENGTVLIEGGRILLVGPGVAIPEGYRVFDAGQGSCLTPGLIDAAATAGIVPYGSRTEHAFEVIPGLRNIDALDLQSRDFARLAAKGVTTVYVTPDPGSVITCRGVVVKTGGPEKDRIVKAEADVKANLGPEGWRKEQRNLTPRGAVDFRTRRPTTRMGMAWVFRKAFYDALACRDNLREPGSGSENPEPAVQALVAVLEGKIPLRIQAREDIDIWSAIRMCKEFGLKFVLEEGTEAYRCIPELKEYGVTVIFGPIFATPRGARARSGELLRPCLKSPLLLAQADIPFALTAGDLAGEDALPRQAGYAIRFGLPFEQALDAVTRAPARILGISDRVGALAPGLDADLVVWNGKPFSPAAKPVLVLIKGEVVFIDEKRVSKPSTR